MNQKEAIEQLENLLGHCESMANRDSHVWDADCRALKLAIAALTPLNEPTCPCDLCMYNSPSSLDGKPCTYCPATGRRPEGEEDT